MPRLEFSTDTLPRALSDLQKLSRYRDHHNAVYGAVDIVRLEDRPFAVKQQFVKIGEIAIGQMKGTVSGIFRNASHVAADSSDDVIITINVSQKPLFAAQRGREIVIGRGSATVFGYNFPGYLTTNGLHRAALKLPRRLLQDAVVNLDDLISKPMDQTCEALQHLIVYSRWLIHPKNAVTNGAMRAHVERTLVDLAALAIGATKDATEIASKRGQRTARTQMILGSIHAGFSNPAFRPQDVCNRLQISERYVHELLAETGITFMERVLELRLQKARALLSTPAHDRLRISDVCARSGFSDDSYFIRRFHRRFGSSPGVFRRG